MPHAHLGSSVHARRLALVLGLTLAMLLVELAVGLVAGSLAVLADAGHMVTDAIGVGVALTAIQVARRPATAERSFGFHRTEILAAVVNAVLSLAIGAVVLVEAWQRLAAPPVVAPLPVVAVGLLGLGVNLAAVWLLRPARHSGLNLRGAYLEVLGDLGGSVAVLVAGVGIALTGRTIIDALASVVVALLILPRAWALLREALDVLLEATPRGVDLDEVRAHILDARGVSDVHDLHAWTITSGMNVLSAHVVLDPAADGASVLDELCRCLSGDFDIEHSTFQLEEADRRAAEEAGHR